MALADWPSDRPYSDYHDEADRILAQWGYPAPSRELGRKREGGPGRLTTLTYPPDRHIPAAPAKHHVVAQTTEQRRERCVAALVAFLEWMARDQPRRTTHAKALLQLAEGTEWPSFSRFEDIGGFTALRTEAQARIDAPESSSSPHFSPRPRRTGRSASEPQSL